MPTRLAAIIGLLFVPALAYGQSRSLVGTWNLVAAEVIRPDGSTVPDYGPSPRGLAVFTADGHYMVEIYRAERIRFASNDKQRGTPEEYRDASLGMSAHFGAYVVDQSAGTIAFTIAAASFPNWDGTTQVRQFTLDGDTLSWRVPPRPDGSVPVSRFARER